MAWVIEMPESRKERRLHNDKNVEKEIFIVEDRGRGVVNGKEYHSKILTIIIAILFVCAIIILFAGIWTPFLLIPGVSLLVLAIGLLMFMMVYENLVSVKNYLRSIDEKLDQ